MNQITKKVEVIVDTNILVEFRNLDEIPWREIFPTASQVLVIVPMAVVEEMDAHKSKTGRLKRRGLWFNQLCRKIEENDDRPIELCNSPISVMLWLGPVFRRSQLDSDQFDLDDPDGRIVAEAVKLSAEYPAVQLLADDAKPLRLARGANLSSIRPPTSWRRKDPPDERDKEIQALKKQLGARPALSVHGDKSFLCNGDFEFENLNTTETPDWFANSLAKKILEANPKIDANYLKRQVNKSQKNVLGNIYATDTFHGISQSQYNSYYDEYNKYEKRVSEYTESYVERSQKLSDIIPIRFEVENTGSALASDVRFSIRLNGNLKFIPNDLVEYLFGEIPDPPDMPKSQSQQLMSAGRFPNMQIDPPDPFDFNQTVKASSDEDSTVLEWRCDQFRHGDIHAPYAFITTTERGGVPKGAVLATIEAGNLVDAESISIPIRGSEKPSAPDQDYLFRRSFFSDYKVYKLIWNVLDR